MPLDAVFLSALTSELNAELTGARIDKVRQPERDELVLSVRTKNGNKKLLISASSGNARIHFIAQARENPDSPPMFCMLLRKHLQGARILGLKQIPMERVLDIEIESSDEFGDEARRHLIIEILGGRSNIILTDGEGLIVDCLRRISPEQPEKRKVLPGLFYRLPEAQDKRDPMALSSAQFEELIRTAPRDMSFDGWLLKNFIGISPIVSRELPLKLLGSDCVRFFELDDAGTAALASKLEDFFAGIHDGGTEPYMLLKDGAPFEFSYMPLKQYGAGLELKRCSGFSELLEEYYGLRAKDANMRRRSKDLAKSMEGARDRLSRKLAIQRTELEATRNRDRLRELGDILSANMHRISRGMDSCVLEDLYAEDCGEIAIKLDPLKTPQQNAAKYYKDYNKLKTAEGILTREAERGERELEYIESVLVEIANADSEADLEVIRSELTETGYIRAHSQKKKQQRTKEPGPLRYTSSAGVPIFVGRNNVQNDRLTLKTADRGDIWLHTQKIHGSHVIIDAADVDDATLYEAAVIAAWHSQGRGGSNVPVDYTRVRHVKKPSGARPGMVIYTDYKTLFVTPDPKQIESMKT